MDRSRHAVNLTHVSKVAKALKHLNERVVFIGGSIVGLLVTDSGAPDVRNTKDVDVIVEVTGLQHHSDTEAELRELGFRHDVSEDAHILRFLLDGLIVDILPENGTRFGMRTGWYELAVRSAIKHSLGDGVDIRLISAPLFICTKFDAYDDRGDNKMNESKDIGDILAVVDGRAELCDEIAIADEKAKQFICSRFSQILKNRSFEDDLSWHIYEENRHEIIMTRIRKIAELL